MGCGHERLWPHSIGIDGFADPKGAIICADAKHLELFADKCMDYVFGAGILDGWEDADVVVGLKEWWRVLRVGGHLLLFHSIKITPRHLRALMEKHCPGWVLVEYDINDNAFIVFRKNDDEVCRFQPWKPGKCPSALVIRYGGFGDMLQTASFFPELAKTHDIFVNTTPAGRNILLSNPHVRGFIIQDPDQVPNEYLGTYWKALEERYDKVINLSESIEGSLLALPGRPNALWSQKRLREKVGRINYFERTFELAQVPFSTPDKGFYPTEDEHEQALSDRLAFDGPLVIWSLSGSSMHKAYPWTDAVIAKLLMAHPTVHVVLVGDALCEILEGGWADEKRVHGVSGKWSIRRTLALIEHADVVVGPETGLLNFAGLLPGVASVVMLSHSSPDNLPKHWVNNTTLQPVNTPCHPCHRLHYGVEHCRIDASTGAALCALNIEPDRVFKAIMKGL